MAKWQDVRSGIGGALLIAGNLLLPFSRKWRCRWGATEAEVKRALPGDELVPTPKWQYTQAITVHAPATEVWQWLAQIGQGRGGFYSYEWLENLIGCDIRNADRILPEFQNLKIGDGIRLHPQMPPMPVEILEPGRAFVLHGDTRQGGPSPMTPKGYTNMSWLFFVEEVSSDTSRVLSRFRTDHDDSFASRLGFGPYFVEPISSVMQREMFRGLKRRAEMRPPLP